MTGNTVPWAPAFEMILPYALTILGVGMLFIMAVIIKAVIGEVAQFFKRIR